MMKRLQIPQNESRLAAPLPGFHSHAGGVFGAEQSDQSGPPGSLFYAVKSVFFCVCVLMLCCLFYEVFISCSTSPGSIRVAAFHHLLFLLLF